MFKSKEPSKIVKQIQSKPNAQEFDFFGESLKNCPEELAQLIRLKRLNLARNKIQVIPECIFYGSTIEDVSLFDNKLTSLPKSMSTMNRIRILNVAYLPFYIYIRIHVIS